MTLIEIVLSLYPLLVVIGGTLYCHDVVARTRIRWALRNLARQKKVVIDAGEEEKKIKWFKKNVYKQNKLLFLSSFLPWINILVFSIYIHYAVLGDPKGEKLLKKYAKEFESLVKADVKEDNTLEEKKDTYLVRYGEDGYYNTICFTMDEYDQVVIEELSGDIKNEDADKQLEITYELLARVRNGDVSGLGFSANLFSLLMPEDKGDTEPSVQRHQGLLRKRKK